MNPMPIILLAVMIAVMAGAHHAAADNPEAEHIARLTDAAIRLYMLAMAAWFAYRGGEWAFAGHSYWVGIPVMLIGVTAAALALIMPTSHEDGGESR